MEAYSDSNMEVYLFRPHVVYVLAMQWIQLFKALVHQHYCQLSRDCLSLFAPSL